VIDLSLTGKVAVITGGSKGLGRAIADCFAQAGAAVALAARGAEDLEAAAKDIESRGGRAIGVPTDVVDVEQVERLMAYTVEELGGIDIVVNNAGAAPFLYSVARPRALDRFEQYLHLNFMGAVNCTHAAARHLLGRRGGAVLNVASIAGLGPAKGLAYYGAAKAAMINFTRTVAREWAPSRVRVNALAPGVVMTDIYGPHPRMASHSQRLVSQIPLGRLGDAEEIAAAALFLCSPAASFITGAVLVVDGGQTLTAIKAP
jgi:NAD(P)-dependent dehydrogenase (short-subunit alcohol dehydrogenase family)